MWPIDSRPKKYWNLRCSFLNLFTNRKICSTGSVFNLDCRSEANGQKREVKEKVGRRKGPRNWYTPNKIPHRTMHFLSFNVRSMGLNYYTNDIFESIKYTYNIFVLYLDYWDLHILYVVLFLVSRFVKISDSSSSIEFFFFE